MLPMCHKSRYFQVCFFIAILKGQGCLKWIILEESILQILTFRLSEILLWRIHWTNHKEWDWKMQTTFRLNDKQQNIYGLFLCPKRRRKKLSLLFLLSTLIKKFESGELMNKWLPKDWDPWIQRHLKQCLTSSMETTKMQILQQLIPTMNASLLASLFFPGA